MEEIDMSNIILARKLLRELMNDYQFDAEGRRRIKRILRLMTREPAIRRHTRARRVKITPHLRSRILSLLKTDMTMHQIATLTGVNNSGRISEVAHDKR
jgi:hypothetical protein